MTDRRDQEAAQHEAARIAFRQTMDRTGSSKQAKAAARRAAAIALTGTSTPGWRVVTLQDEVRRLREEREVLLVCLADALGVSVTTAWRLARLELDGQENTE
jgi:hypothetical protein